MQSIFSTFLVILVALGAILVQSRRHYWGTDGIDAPLYGSPKESVHDSVEKGARKFGLEPKVDQPTPNRTPYLLAMNRRAPGASNPHTLHGLWYQFAQDCQNDAGVQPFNVNLLDPIREEMDQWWPSFNHDNPTFWLHEYDKHLSCMISQSFKRNSTMTLLQSFQISLDLLHQYSDHCDNTQLTDCRCDLDANFKLVSCRQK